MLKTLRHKIINYLINFTQTQLTITLVSLPILISWGLGFSVMTFLGNLIYTPVLIIFLIISSLLLFSEIAGIPNKFLAQMLDSITSWWSWVLNHGSESWLITCAKPPTIILILIPIIVFVVLHLRNINSTQRRISVLLFMLLMCCGICSLQKNYNASIKGTARFNSQLYVIKLLNSPSVIMIDKGYFSRKKSIDKAADYELKQWLIKTYGTIDIKELRMTNPNMGSFKAATYLAEHWKIDEVWIPFFKKSLSKAGWKSFFELKRILSERNIRLVRYAEKPYLRNLYHKKL